MLNPFDDIDDDDNNDVDKMSDDSNNAVAEYSNIIYKDNIFRAINCSIEFHCVC